MDLSIFKRDLDSAGGVSRGAWLNYDPRRAPQTLPGRLRELSLWQPDRRALVDAVSTLTYAELDRAMNRVARAIARSRGTGRAAVLLLFDVGAPGVVAALGALAAGKFWVGVEPTFTPDRMRQIAEDAGADLVLTDAQHASQARALGREAIVLDEIPGADADPLDVRIDLDDVALLNYTSGSTGRPKGVAQSHRSAICQGMRFVNAYQFGDEDCIATFGSLAWAGALWDLFGTLASGGCLGEFDTRVYGIPRLVEWIDHTGVTVLAGTKATIRLALDFPERRMPGVRLIQMGGDTVYRRDVLACQRVFPNAIVSVGLGTSEAGRATQLFLAPGVDPVLEVVPIGWPLPGVRTFLAGEDGSVLDPGATGEIAAQSDDLSIGYWNLPEKTADRFRREPRYGDERVYFTGDLGRDLGDGLLLHIGRRDFQVKVRGYQVPTGEVEGLLLQMPGMRDACVVGRRLADGNDQLLAFVSGDQSQMLAAEEMRSRVGAQLPEHMVPQRIVVLDALPKTPTGKTDRNALPFALASRRPLGAPCVAPRTPFEASVAGIWRDVLALDEVGVTDEYLALGGDSMRAMQVVSRVLREFGVDLPMSAPLSCRTVEEMAALIAGTMAAGLDAAELEYLEGREGARDPAT